MILGQATVDQVEKAEREAKTFLAKIWLLHSGGPAAFFQLLSRVRLFVTAWTVASQTPLSMGFLRQECWSGLPFPSPGDLPNPETEPT